DKGENQLPRQEGHFARSHEDRQIIERKGNPKRRSQPEERNGNALEPNVGANAPTQAGKERLNFGRKGRCFKFAGHVKNAFTTRLPSPEGTAVNSQGVSPWKRRKMPTQAPKGR